MSVQIDNSTVPNRPQWLCAIGVDISSGAARAVRCQFDKRRETPGGWRRTTNKMLHILLESTRFQTSWLGPRIGFETVELIRYAPRVTAGITNLPTGC